MCLFFYTEKDGLKKLLVCWTAWPLLQDEGLKVEIGGDSCYVRTCFNKIELPAGMTEDRLREQIRIFIDCSGGFGMM